MGFYKCLGYLSEMGICLDTGTHQDTLPIEEVKEAAGNSTPIVRSEPERQLASVMANSSVLSQAESSRPAFVIFFLGGPGSGKVSHAQNLADLHIGYRHINMVIIMSEYVKENEVNLRRLQSQTKNGLKKSSKETLVAFKTEGALGPPENLSPAVALALLAREFQNSSNCRAFLVSGYPRHLGDMHLFTEKLGHSAGAILMELDKRALVRNIELGRLDGAILLDYQEACDEDGEEATLSYMVAEAARRELQDFYVKVLPVCEHLDNIGTLYVVSGERSKEEIFRDVERAHARIIKPNMSHPPSRTSIGSYREFRRMLPFAALDEVVQEKADFTHSNQENNNLPPFLFLMGGPGSNKGSLLKEMMYLYPGWTYINVGAILRARIAYWRAGHKSPEGIPADKLELMENILGKGDLVPQELVMEILSHRIEELRGKEGVILVGFPRDVHQAQAFEEKFAHVPPLVLLDCSELELGRSLGRRERKIDDNVAAAHRRLDTYRQITLPMLKAFDEKNRLRIIDGDADIDQVIKELKRAIYVETKMLSKKRSRSLANLKKSEEAFSEDDQEESLSSEDEKDIP